MSAATSAASASWRNLPAYPSRAVVECYSRPPAARVLAAPSSCARTLGCRSWRLLARDHECCLGLEAPEKGGEGFEHGEVLHPCERGCLAFGQPSISNVSLDDVPWLRVQHQLKTPLSPPVKPL